jgi:hypothetical protein
MCSTLTLVHRPHHYNSNDIDDKLLPRAKQRKNEVILENKSISKIPTGGSGTEPVSAVYCLKISLGDGPMKKKPSNMPDSNIQCVVTSGTSSFSLVDLVPKKFVIVEKRF